VYHVIRHKFFGLALPSRCHFSKKVIKIGLFFAMLEPRMKWGFLSRNAKKEGEKPNFS